MDVRDELLVGQHQIVADAVGRQCHPARKGATDLKAGLPQRLTVEDISDGVDRVVLIGQRGIEFELHRGSPLYRTEFDGGLAVARAGLKGLHGVGLKLVITLEAGVEANDALRLKVSQGVDDLLR